MSVYQLAVFLHVTAALAIFGALTVEWVTMPRLQRATSVRQVRETLQSLQPLRYLGLPSMLVLLVTGLYLGATSWGHQPWIGLGLLGMIVMAILGGGVTGRRMLSLARSLPDQDGAVSRELAARLKDPALALSLWLRIAIGLGVVFLMTAKPGLAVAALVLPIAAGAGLLAAAAARGSRRARVSDTQASHPQVSQ